MAFNYYKSLTVDHAQCGSVDSVDFPLSIYVTDPDLKSVANGGFVESADGFDIRPYLDLGTTPATFELVTYNPVTGTIELHIKVPTISATVDTVLYLYFGDSALITDGSSPDTWDSDFLAVYHFPNGSTLSVIDSTSNGNDGVNTGVAAAAGLINGGANFETIAVDNILLPGLIGSLGGLTQFTSSTRIFPATTGNNQAVVRFGSNFGLGAANASPFFRMFVYIRDGIHGGLDPVLETGDNGYVEGAWNHHACIINGASQVLKLNNSNVATNTATFSGFDVGADNFVVLGFHAPFDALPGIYDEFRFSSVARSDSWLTTEYNNLKGSSTLITWGTLTPLTPPVVVTSGYVTSLSMGPQITLTQNTEYALPARAGLIHSTAALEISIDRLTWTALTNADTTGTKVAGGFIRCPGGTAVVTLRRFRGF